MYYGCHVFAIATSAASADLAQHTDGSRFLPSLASPSLTNQPRDSRIVVLPAIRITQNDSDFVRELYFMIACSFCGVCALVQLVRSLSHAVQSMS